MAPAHRSAACSNPFPAPVAATQAKVGGIRRFALLQALLQLCLRLWPVLRMHQVQPVLACNRLPARMKPQQPAALRRPVMLARTHLPQPHAIGYRIRQLLHGQRQSRRITGSHRWNQVGIRHGRRSLSKAAIKAGRVRSMATHSRLTAIKQPYIDARQIYLTLGPDLGIALVAQGNTCPHNAVFRQLLIFGFV